MAQKIPIDVLLDAWYLKHADEAYDVPLQGTIMPDLELRVLEHIAGFTVHQHQKGVHHTVTRFYPVYLVHVRLFNDKIWTIAVSLRS